MNLDSLRRIVQYLTLLISNCYLGFVSTKQVYQGSLKSSCVPFLHCHTCPSALFSCPVGIVQHFVTQRSLPYTLLAYLISVGISVGSMACGWLCPFGLLQDLMYKIKSVKLSIPHQLSHFRYFILFFLVLLIPLITQETWYCKLCPAGTLEAALPWVLWNPIMPLYNEPVAQNGNLGVLFIVKIGILVALLGAMTASKRVFCRTLCPLGAIFGLFNKISLLSLSVDKANCTSCDDCVTKCPVDLNVSDNPNASTCVRCMKCLECDNVSLDIAGFMKNKTPTVSAQGESNQAKPMAKES
ncbi:MAG: 4Fe-4S binding protein [Planctomycetes bacterium]|nr:4Fe-4S binding protein [Planctomycetota bacterium]